ncbi:hypothetical protein PsYK624_067110 [Phanerochaete sordida]|uniref:Uncharacterized protein n=1 Tax=Phanerochaete sordida TaxID=48140 RepID=A0A9P3LDP0_9APHY|nr:hypothetical protein PsYK624_067110 [Phanerochaete sordida]
MSANPAQNNNARTRQQRAPTTLVGPCIDASGALVYVQHPTSNGTAPMLQMAPSVMWAAAAPPVPPVSVLLSGPTFDIPFVGPAGEPYLAPGYRPPLAPVMHGVRVKQEEAYPHQGYPQQGPATHGARVKKEEEA